MNLKTIIGESENIVFFGGAGVSTESGIPDFRSESGIYAAVAEYGVAPEKILSHSFFMKDTALFYDFYRKKIIHIGAQPNDAHIALAKLEVEGKLKAVITQNIDGLHQLAGSRRVYEIHGSIHRNFCMRCGESYGLSKIAATEGVPKCDRCGGLIKPDVVLYEEPLDSSLITQSIRTIQEADVLIVGGTSLSVYPAAGLIRYFGGRYLVVVNKGETQADRHADLRIYDSIGKVLKQAIG